MCLYQKLCFLHSPAWKMHLDLRKKRKWRSTSHLSSLLPSFSLRLLLANRSIVIVVRISRGKTGCIILIILQVVQQAMVICIIHAFYYYQRRYQVWILCGIIKFCMGEQTNEWIIIITIIIKPRFTKRQGWPLFVSSFFFFLPASVQQEPKRTKWAQTKEGNVR